MIMLPYNPQAEELAKVLLGAREAGVDNAYIGRVLFAVLNAPTLIQSAFVRALSDKSVWAGDAQWYLRETLRGNLTYADQMSQYLGGFVNVRQWLDRAEATAVAEGSPRVCEQHIAYALKEVNGPQLDSMLGRLGINGQQLAVLTREMEGEIVAEPDSRGRGPTDAGPLLAELIRLLDMRSVVEAKGPMTADAQRWLASVSAVLSQVDGAEAARFKQRAHTIQRSLSSYTTGPIWNEMLLIIRRTIERLRVQTRSSEVMDRDALTGLGSRACFDSDLPQLLAEAREAGTPLALIETDIDDFKRINDELGHQVGDRALQAVASELGKLAKGRGRAYRYGGEEMVLVLVNTTLPEAMAVGERARTSVERLDVRELGRPITISLGIAVFPDHATSAETLFKQVDDALYRAKRTGKNRVETVASS
jgi:diguanylate cyclase (GGDEF)-like protein